MESKRLVIAVDNSTEGLEAIDFVIQHFPKGYTYYLVHVESSPRETAIISGAAGAEFAHANTYAVEKELGAAATAVLEKVFAPRAASAGAAVTTMKIQVTSDSSSHIGAAICEYAEKVKADALVLMRHNKTALRRFFLGSVTEHCAVHSPVPVIIVPGNV